MPVINFTKPSPTPPPQKQWRGGEGGAEEEGQEKHEKNPTGK